MKKVIRTGHFEITEEEKIAILDVLNSGRITEYTKTREFEKNWAEKIGTKYAIAVNSGTSALITGFQALKYLAKDRQNSAPSLFPPLPYTN